MLPLSLMPCSVLLVPSWKVVLTANGPAPRPLGAMKYCIRDVRKRPYIEVHMAHVVVLSSELLEVGGTGRSDFDGLNGCGGASDLDTSPVLRGTRFPRSKRYQYILTAAKRRVNIPEIG